MGGGVLVKLSPRVFFYITFSISCFSTFSISLALHCCKAHAKINRKIENLTPCKIVTHEDFSLKLGTRDYVQDVTHHATFWSNQSSGSFPQISDFLLSCFFFFITRPGRTVAPILTLNGSNDVFPPKDGTSGSQVDG